MQNSEREQAQALLARIASVDPNASFAARAQQIAALRATPLSAPALVAVRDGCVQAHAGLLAAEREQSAARARIERAEHESRRDPAEIAAIAAQLAHAANSLRGAHAALPDCERRARELLLHKR